MKILSIDTSTQVGSVAVLHDEKVCAEVSYQTKSSHAEVLMGVIEEALKKAILIGRVAQDFSPAGSVGRSKDLRYKAGLDDIDGIAVAIGPGSFTGLRIGLATAKGLAIATGKPIVGISTLEALALNPPQPPFFKGGGGGIIVSCINAYRGEVYCRIPSPLGPRPSCSSGGGEGHLPAGGSVAGGEGADVTCECSITPEALCDILCRGGAQSPPEFLFIGDGAIHYKDLFKERLGKRFKLTKGDRFPIAAEVGLLALPRFREGRVSDIITLAPNYIRKSDAELKL